MMISSLRAGGVVLMLAAAPALAQDPPTYKSVDVKADLADVTNPAAASYWGALEADLESAIATRLGNRIAEKGIDIEVDITEVELSSGFTEQMGLADTLLDGQVRLRSEDDPGVHETFNLRVDVNQARTLIPADVDVTTLPADTRVYYDALIAGYANAVVERLP